MKMKKIACLLLLLQSGLIMAQKETFVTVNGKKVQLDPNAVSTADNGLTAENGNMQLGGALLKATTLTTTDANTLAIKGLQTGAETDNILTADADGVLKWVNRSSLSGNSKAVKVINTNYTVTDADYTIIASKLSGDITVTLPDAAANKGRMLLVAQTNAANTSGAEVTVKFNTDVIYSDGLSKSELTSSFYSATGGTLKINLQSDGTSWYVVSSL